MATTNTNSNTNYTGNVQKYVGSAYDQMRLISTNIEALLALAQAIEDGDLEEIIELAPVLNEVIEKVDQFNGVYWGAHDTEPTLDVNGVPPHNGDMYYNNPEQEMKVYGEATGTWTNLNEILRTVEHYVIAEDDPDPHTIIIQNPYAIGMNNLMVYKNGEILVSNQISPTDFDYQESSTYSIILPDGVVTGDEFVIAVNTEISTTNHIIQVEQGIYTIPDNTNRTLLTVPDGLTYVPGQFNMDVYRDRQLLLPNIDYDEVSPSTIQIYVPGTLGEEFVFKIGQIISNIPRIQQIIMQDSKPDETLYANGQGWFDTGKGRLFLLYVDSDSRQWLSTGGENEVIL